MVAFFALCLGSEHDSSSAGSELPALLLCRKPGRAGYAWRSGRTGRTSRLKVKLVTPANDAYQAAAAVASPNQPPSLVIESLPAASPIPSRMNVTVRSRKTRLTAAVVRNERSEEHTSELQSRPHLVCRLLLEKKKNKIYIIILSTKKKTIQPN